MDTTSVLVENQKKVFGPRAISGYGHGAMITAQVRYDDQCGNGHNSFSITGEVRVNGRDVAGGCLHEEVVKAFPELAPFIKWHLFDSTGPMHYISNTLYFAGDKDCHGLRKGEFRQFVDRKTGLLAWKLGVDDVPKTIDAVEKPASVTIEYVPWGRTGEGKERELDAARKSAVWPDATDEELTALDLREKLEARLPKLTEEFRAAVEFLGFTW